VSKSDEKKADTGCLFGAYPIIMMGEVMARSLYYVQDGDPVKAAWRFESEPKGWEDYYRRDGPPECTMKTA
jgi:hypothetical protein